MYSVRDVVEVLQTIGKLLVFRPVKPDFARHGNLYLLFGIVFSWLAGIGRRWDDPRATLLQHTGLVSVIYIFVLALILWLFALPFRPHNWSYKNVLTFVGLTAPPALLYAIPVERFMSFEMATTANIWFLLIVAVWRVALLFTYLKRSAGLNWWTAVIAILLPLDIIVVTLTLLNLDNAIFEIMAGISGEGHTAHDGSYAILLNLTMLSVLLAPVVIAAYAIATSIASKKLVPEIPATVETPPPSEEPPPTE